MAAGMVRSGNNDGKHQAVRHKKIIEVSAAAVQPHVCFVQIPIGAIYE